jgi:hypothetical protein
MPIAELIEKVIALPGFTGKSQPPVRHIHVRHCEKVDIVKKRRDISH